MKVCALIALLVCCIVQNASADWRSDVKVSHYQHINSIINDTLSSLPNGSTPAAKQCYENARLALRNASSTGYSKVNTCVSQASNAGAANVCAQQVDSEVFNISLEVSRTARACAAAASA